LATARRDAMLALDSKRMRRGALPMVEGKKGLRFAGLAVASALAVAAAHAQQADLGPRPVTVANTPYTFDTAEQHGIRVSVVVRGLAHPFSLAFLPNGDALVAERSGNLRLVRNAASAQGGAATLVAQPLSGMPESFTQRTSGLHDLALHPQFAQNSLVYFSYNKLGDVIPDSNPPGRRQAAITVQRGRLSGTAVTNVEEIFAGEWSTGSSGSRLAFGTEGLLYVSTGAPFGATTARDPASVYGKILRLRDDGKVPEDNPYVKQAGARPEVFSMGHRDQLGLTVHPNGAVLAAEHGPNGGDEVNLILPGRDYGWPTWTYGRNYDGTRLSALPVTEGIEQPLVLWVPSIAPTGLAVYTGDKIPAWRNNLFVGSARIGEIPRTGGLERVVFNDNLEEVRRERLLGSLQQRIRDVRQGPDGLLYVVTDEDDGALLRIEPTAL
jgi:glucose/arabinose dehydrogenase